MIATILINANEFINFRAACYRWNCKIITAKCPILVLIGSRFFEVEYDSLHDLLDAMEQKGRYDMQDKIGIIVDHNPYQKKIAKDKFNNKKPNNITSFLTNLIYKNNDSKKRKIGSRGNFRTDKTSK